MTESLLSKTTLIGGPRTANANVASPARVANVPPRVLVVDDDPDAADLTAMALESMGYRVEIAHDAASALLAMARFSPDAALLDISLPGMDGYELSLHIRADARYPRVALVALTGYDGESDVRRGRDAGFDGHLGKPVDLDRLELTLKALLEARH